MLALNHRVGEGLSLTDAEWSHWRKRATSSSSSAGKRRKRKKRRKKLLRTSSHSPSGRARRRQRQWHARFAGFAGDVLYVLCTLRSSPGLTGMDLKDNPRVWCAHRRLWQWHVQGSFFFLALCSMWLQTGPYACHNGRYGPEGHSRSWLVLLVTFSRCVSFVVVRPRCSASWPAWIRRTDLSDTVLDSSGRLLLENVSYSAQCLVRHWIQYLRQSVELYGGQFFNSPLYLAVTSLVLVFLKSACLDFSWRRLLDLFPYSALLGSTVDTRSSVHRGEYVQCKLLQKPEVPQRSSSMVVDITVVAQRPFSLILRPLRFLSCSPLTRCSTSHCAGPADSSGAGGEETVEIPQLQLVEAWTLLFLLARHRHRHRHRHHRHRHRHSSRCVPDVCSLTEWRSVHSRCFGRRAVFSSKTWTLFPRAPCILQYVQLSAGSAG